MLEEFVEWNRYLWEQRKLQSNNLRVRVASVLAQPPKPKWDENDECGHQLMRITHKVSDHQLQHRSFWHSCFPEPGKKLHLLLIHKKVCRFKRPISWQLCVLLELLSTHAKQNNITSQNTYKMITWWSSLPLLIATYSASTVNSRS
jgi:hypothetical protein